MPPMKRVVAAAQRRTHSGASDSDQRKGRGGAGCDSDSHSVKGHPIRFFDLENWQILKEEGKAVCRFGCPNCSAKLLQTAKLPN